MPVEVQDALLAQAEAPQAPQEKSLAALLDCFKTFDRDGNGKIERHEFQALMRSLGAFTSKEITKLFNEADADESGAVDLREFLKWIVEERGPPGSKNCMAKAAASLGRLLKRDLQDEASFVQQVNLSQQVTAYLKEHYAEKSECEEQNALKRKQYQVKRSMEDSSRPQAGIVDDLGIGDSYDGFRLPMPVTLAGAEALVQHFLVYGQSRPLHPKYVSYLTTEFTSMYRKKHPKPVVALEIPKTGRLNIVGDTHGQLADVLHIFYQLGCPSRENKYLFNGDMVDRGKQGVEILLLIFAFFIADPEALVVNRGNHENEDLNTMDSDDGGGFSEEVQRKYGLSQYRRFVSSFKVLSLCVVVEQEIFVVHGGLTRVKSLTMEYINSLNFHDCTSPLPASASVKDQIFSDLLWSDPTEQDGKFKSERGVGIKFGPDVTIKFCTQNNFRFIIRSHELPANGKGFIAQHDGRCVTIFSASNYCGSGGNYGAVLVLRKEIYPKYEIHEHYAAPLADVARSLEGSSSNHLLVEHEKSSQEAAIGIRWEKELEKIIVAIIEKKPTLYSHIIDSSVGSCISLQDWEEMMTELVEPNAAWAEAASHWGLVCNNFVEVDKFLTRWTVSSECEGYSSFIQNAVKTVYEAILALDMDLTETFKLFDVDGDGTVDLKEARQVLGMFELGLTPSQLDRLTGQLFARCTSAHGIIKMNVQEFLGRFTVLYAAGSSQTLPAWVAETLQKIAQLIVRTPTSQLSGEQEMARAATMIQKIIRGKETRKALNLSNKTEGQKAPSVASAVRAIKHIKHIKHIKAMGLGKTGSRSTEDDIRSKMLMLFGALDVSGDGVLQVSEFVTGIEKLPGIHNIEVDGKLLTHDTLVDMAKAIDVTGNGEINYLEFTQAFEQTNEGSKDIKDTLAEDVTTVLFRHRMAIRAGCQYLDEDGNGAISAEDFIKVLQGVNAALSRPERSFTQMQIELLVDAISKPQDAHDGSTRQVVDYDTFLRSFVIVDTLDNSTIKKI